MGFRITFLLIFLILHVSITVSAETPLTAAFIRDHQLWIKKGDQEIQITQDQYVFTPKWSFDGRFIAYIDGDEQGKKSDLFIYDTKENESYQPYIKVETYDFKWSPNKNQLAYTDHGLLNVTKIKNGHPQGFENVSLGVSGFEWFPNGKEFLVSSQSVLRPTGWGPIPLFKVPVDANLAQEKIKPFYTIQTNERDLFAISADYFKWSNDGEWVSFLAIPTGSIAMDGNTLCVISSKGERFEAVGKMLWYEDWTKWAPSTNQLAYISGEGRFFVENKNTTIVDMPTSTQQQEYTPKGYVDLDLEWFSSDKVIVARANENKEWKEGPAPKMFTSLYAINLKTKEQMRITNPNNNELDRDPQVVGTYITWFRKHENEYKGDIWLKHSLNGQEQIWIKDAGAAPVFFIGKQ
ncbi:translocation protein TolB [Cytobacillus suaedae]|nr:translocation protein TolB [Cytobacillus suaedae]